MKLSSIITIAVAAAISFIPHILLLTAEVIVNFALVKPGIEKIVSEGIEIDFKIDGGIDIRFLTMVSLAANDLKRLD